MKKIIAISLAVLLLATNIGLAINSHFCGGNQVKSALGIGIASLNCGMDESAQACDDNFQTKLQPSPCCQDHYQVLQTEGDMAYLQIFNLVSAWSIEAIDIPMQHLTATMPLTKESRFICYMPPPLLVNYPLLFHNFRL